MTATFTITVNARALKAAAMCASNEETRFYLKGVFVETTPAGVTLTATDGHRLVAMNHGPAVDAPHDASAPANFNPAYIATFGKMCELMTGGKPRAIHIISNGENPALVDFLDDLDAGGVEAFGVLMPCRLGASRYAGRSVPAWYDPNPVPAAPAGAGLDVSQEADAA